MAFYGRNFIFDGKASENYNLTITSLDGEANTPGPDVELITTKIYRRPVEFLYGVSQKPVLQFPVVFNTPEELTSEQFGLISSWLFGKQVFKKFQVLQEDMVDTYFNCFMVNPQIIRKGNIIRGVSATVRCDSPFGWTFPRVSTYTYGSPPSGVTITFDNYSHDSYYLFPKIEFTMTGAGGTFSLWNVTDSNRLFQFTTLSAGEVITVDNSLEIVTSTVPGLKLPKFNMNFFRFLQGRNTLTVTGNITNLTFTYQFAKKIGG